MRPTARATSTLRWSNGAGRCSRRPSRDRLSAAVRTDAGGTDTSEGSVPAAGAETVKCWVGSVTMEPRVDDVGTIVGGRFELEALAGRGGMGTVYRARDRVSGSCAAVKILRDGTTAEHRDRFMREAQRDVRAHAPGIRPLPHVRQRRRPAVPRDGVARGRGPGAAAAARRSDGGRERPADAPRRGGARRRARARHRPSRHQAEQPVPRRRRRRSHEGARLRHRSRAGARDSPT